MSTTSSKRPSNVSLPDLNVSLEPHLVRDLVPLLSLLPDELASELNSALKDRIPHGGEPSPDDPRQETSLISYRLLYSISVWARSPHGATALSSHIPVLDTNQYTMIALLAGTKTSPERKFPTTNTWSRDHEAEAKRELSDRRAVVAVLNALLSILGSGAATWWAAEKLQWRDEWVSHQGPNFLHSRPRIPLTRFVPVIYSFRSVEGPACLGCCDHSCCLGRYSVPHLEFPPFQKLCSAFRIEVIARNENGQKKLLKPLQIPRHLMSFRIQQWIRLSLHHQTFGYTTITTAYASALENRVHPKRKARM